MYKNLRERIEGFPVNGMKNVKTQYIEELLLIVKNIESQNKKNEARFEDNLTYYKYNFISYGIINNLL